MSYAITRKDEHGGERRAGVADSLAEAERALLACVMREADSLWLRDRRSVAVTFAGGTALVVDLGRGRVVAVYSFNATEPAYTNGSDDEFAATDVLELVTPAPGRVWP